MKIFEIIPLIIGEIGAIEKKKSPEGGVSYKYRGIDDFLNALNPLLAKHGCFIVPEVINRTNFERTFKSGSLNFHSIVTYKFTIYASDGTSICGSTDGEAMDTSDKASGKTLSYALKTFMTAIFAVPTEDTKDPDFERPEAETEAEKKLREAKNARITGAMNANLNPDAHKKAIVEMVQPKQIELLKKAREEAKLTQDDVKQMMRVTFSTEDIYEMESWQVNLLISMIKKKTK